MFDVKDTLLPPTATPLAKALDILEERLFSLPVQTISKDPATVDVGLLDHLAWENSVDVWDPIWPEHIKRAVIAVSSEVHRYKGTPYAIKTALKSFGVDVELVEWFDPDGSGVPGTFTARAFVTDPLDGADELIVTAPVVSAMKSMLNSVSPVSRGWSLQLGVRAESQNYIGAFPVTCLQATADYRIDPPPLSVVAASFAAIPTTQIKSTVTTA